MAEPIVDFSAFPGLGYKNSDIQTVVVAIEGEPKPNDLEGITN